MNDEQFFTILAANTDAMHGTGERAPARLKSRLYSTRSPDKPRAARS